MKHNAFFIPATLTTQLSNALRLKRLGLTLILLLTLGLNGSEAHAQTYAEKTLHSFRSGSDGAGSDAGLVSVGGVLYGTTYLGGSESAGTIFSVNPDGTGYQTLYTFQNTSSTDGANPNGDLLLVNGKLYGTTYLGGSKNAGTLFSFDPASNTEKTLYSFQFNSSTDGGGPTASLINVNGILYGTTYYGGTSGYGTVFSFDPISLKEITIHNFTGGGDGNSPVTGLLAVNGLLYGTTEGGGSLSHGIVFSLDPSTGVEHILHTFTGVDVNGDGSNPESNLILLNNVLYGTTVQGGVDNGAYGYGTVYSLRLNGTGYQVLYAFTDTLGDGANPYASLIAVNGLLYGTTGAGGIDSKGTVFAIDPASGDETTLYDFSDTDSLGYNPDGANPSTDLIAINGTLYGTAGSAGPSGFGTVFSLTPVYPPTAVNDKYIAKYNTAYAVHAPGVLANDTSGGQTPLTATLVTHVSHGTLTFNSDGSFTYTPAAGFVGTDTFTYKAANPSFQGNTATVSLVVQAVVPVAHNDAYIPTYNKAYAVKAPGVLANDFNGDNQTMTAALVAGPAHGTLTFNSDGSFLYTSKLGFAGTDTFTYQAIDPIGKSNTATVTITIHPIVPIAYNDTYAPKYATAFAVKAPGVLANDDTGGTTPLTAALVTSPTHGTFTFYSDGSFTYTPNSGFVGSDTFTYKNSTTVGTSNTATVTLKVTAAVPVAHNDAYTVKHNTPFSVNAAGGVLADDYTGDNVAPMAVLVTSTTHGSLAFHSDGSFVYTPNTGYSGTDTFTYKDTNPVGTSNTATVTLTVQ